MKGPDGALLEGKTRRFGRGSLGFLRKKCSWKILGVENNWAWKKKLVQALNISLKEKGEKDFII